MAAGCTRARTEAGAVVAPGSLSSSRTVLGLRNQTVQDLFLVPRTKPVDWSHAAVGRLFPRSAGHPLVTTLDSSENIVVFIATPDTSGRVFVEAHYAVRGMNDYWMKLRVEPIPVLPEVPRCSKGTWVAAFFIEGVGATPKSEATVHFLEGDSVLHTLRLHPQRNLIRARAALEFHTRDVHGLNAAVPGGVSATLKRDPNEAPSIHLLLNQNATGWKGSGVSEGRSWSAWFAWIGITWRDIWRDYVLDDVSACQMKPNR